LLEFRDGRSEQEAVARYCFSLRSWFPSFRWFVVRERWWSVSMGR